LSSSKQVHVAIRCVDNLTERIESVYDRVTEKAYEPWLREGSSRPPIAESWSAAERDLVFEPQTRIREWGHGVIVELECPDVDPTKVRLFMSSTELLALAPLSRPGDQWLFRHLQFETELDLLDATAEIANNVLRICATYLNAPEEQKLRFSVA
jgi:hypothetical protein